MNKVAKLQSRLNAALASKQFYEAHQILRTVHARLSAEQKFAELLEQLHSTVLIFCEGYARAADYLLGEVDRLLNPPAPDDETESIENLERDGGDEHKMDAEIDLD
uniref:Uncharacterized protein n=1 Tax=Globodera pallida TaxID=36090 RepID=A0A183BS68_GLOPA